jgi:hypothetical protein
MPLPHTAKLCTAFPYISVHTTDFPEQKGATGISEEQRMKRKKEAKAEFSQPAVLPGRPFDEADWVDWDHWQSVEELQNFMNGLADSPYFPEDALPDSANEAGQQDRIARHFHRHGLEIEG